MSDLDKRTEAIARATHEANRAYCIAIGDDSQPPWDEAPAWQLKSAINGAALALAGATPEESHESWRREKVDDGWTWGPEKNPIKKEHPCLVPYAQLPPEQQAKDELFLAVARAMGRALGVAEHDRVPDQLERVPDRLERLERLLVMLHDTSYKPSHSLVDEAIEGMRAELGLGCPAWPLEDP